MQGIGFLPGHSGSTAYGVSADGKTVVGLSSSDVDLQAFRWTASGGMTSLGELPGNDPDLVLSVAYDTTADGGVAVGYGEIAVPGGFEMRAFIWDAAHGMRRLDQVLANDHGLGAALTGWTLYEATAISDDGDAVTGYGRNPSGDTEAWVAMPEPAMALGLGMGTASLIALAGRRRGQSPNPSRFIIFWSD
jgi:probable HAF family extracellular repeat protein